MTWRKRLEDTGRTVEEHKHPKESFAEVLSRKLTRRIEVAIFKLLKEQTNPYYLDSKVDEALGRVLDHLEKIALPDGWEEQMKSDPRYHSDYLEE